MDELWEVEAAYAGFTSIGSCRKIAGKTERGAENPAGISPCGKIETRMRSLLKSYHAHEQKTLEEIIDFHYALECIHPFQDGNGRVGRLLLFKECLRNHIVPFIIDEELKWFYYRGLSEWRMERGYLMDTCLAAQDKFKKYLDYFRIPYEK